MTSMPVFPTTRQVRVHSPGNASLDRVDLPVCGPRDALVEVHACGLCGSDLSYIRLGGLAGPGGEPMPLGHEFSGVVRAVGAEVSGIAPGRRVVVHPGDEAAGRIGGGSPAGGLADVVLVREAAGGGRLIEIPDGMPIDVAALTEPVAVGMHAAEQADVGPGDTVAVFGCGPVGLAAIAALADRGLVGIVGVDPSARRRRLAEDLGASAAIDPDNSRVWRELRRLHGSRPPPNGHAPATDAFIEASGSDAVLTDIIDRAGPGARISVVGLHYQPVPVNFLSVLMKELTIRGSMEYPARFADAVDLLARRDLSALITHRFPLEDIGAALDLLADSRECGKVMITPRGDLS
jgi:threonine dehydrogenase-like Zn-dependent dehydrogenase